jgi:hypothetical protein
VSEEQAAVTAAMAGLSRLRPDSRFSLNAVPLASAGSRAVSTVWIAGELPSRSAADPWMKGGTVELEIKAGGKSSSARVNLAAGERGFAVPVTLTAPVESGMLEVRARLAGADPGAAALDDFLRMDVAQGLGQPLIYRRSAATGNRVVPAAAFQFSRTERAHMEFPVAADAKAGGARLLDRNGQGLAIPIALGERIDERTSQRWITADITLAPLGAGDYGIELTLATASAQQKVVTAIRVGR